MLEALGIGVRATDGAWRIRHVTVRLPARTLAVVVSRDARRREAVLEAITGCVVPEEGRVWLSGVPLMRRTQARFRTRVADVDVAPAVAEGGPAVSATQSALEAALRARRAAAWWRWLPRRRAGTQAAALCALQALGLGAKARVPMGELSAGDRAVVHCARALVEPRTAMAVRTPPPGLRGADVERLLHTLRAAARSRGLSVVVALPSAEPALDVADGVLELDEGALRHGAWPRDVGPASWRPGALA